MSMAKTISGLVAEQRLFPYRGRQSGPTRRRLYLTEQALRDFEDRGSAVNLLCGRGAIEAAMTRWVSGGLVYGVEEDGEFVSGGFIKRLDPPPKEIWEMRVTEPEIQARLFGRFAEPNAFVLTRFHARTSLGRKRSRAWKTAMNECEEAWRALFGTDPFHGLTIHDYVTEKCDDFPI